MPLNSLKNIDNSIAKDHYDKLSRNYLDCWRSLAKRDINNFEIDFVDKWTKQIRNKKRTIKVLEIGFGPGRIARSLLKYNIEYYGLDISKEMYKTFTEEFKNEKKVKKITLGDIGTDSFYNGIKFDLIVAMRVLYYSKNWRENIKKLQEKLTQGGTLLFTMPNFYSIAILGNLFGKLKGQYVKMAELKRIMSENKLNTKFFGYAKISDIIYDICNTKTSSGILLKIEVFLRKFFGEIFLTKMFYVVSKKEGGEIIK